MRNKTKIIITILILILLQGITLTSFATTNTQKNIPESNSITNKLATIESTSVKITNETKNEQNINLILNSKSCILIEKSTNRIAYEKNAYEKMYPASTTKLLTAILAIEKCNLSDSVIITNEMISKIPTGYTIANLQVGESLTVEQLLNVLLIPSANDAGYALAIHISGSIENFSVLMNEKAKQIGCKNSNFTNPSGIHNENHYSTSYDMSLIGMYSLKYPIICEIGKTISYSLPTVNGINRNFETTNTLLKNTEKSYYECATGLKTGYTKPAGSCIVATAKKSNMEFLLVILGSPEPTKETNFRDEDCKTLFEYGFTNFETITKSDNNFLTFFKNLNFSNMGLNLIFKTTLIISIFYFTYAILNKKKKKKNKNKKKYINKNDLIDYKFDCSF